ncbi:UNVERIFIED_CONTAM: hypothetical protein K2H54_006965 [Gekko kuhli]
MDRQSAMPAEPLAPTVSELEASAPATPDEDEGKTAVFTPGAAPGTSSTPPDLPPPVSRLRERWWQEIETRHKEHFEARTELFNYVPCLTLSRDCD